MPRPRFWLMLILLLPVLASCANTGSSLSTAAPDTPPTATPFPAPEISFLPTETPAAFYPGEFETCILSSEENGSAYTVAPVTEDDHRKGAENASLQYIVYYDLQCPYCAALHPVLDALLEEYPDQLEIIYRPLPLPNHDKAMLAAQIIEAASRQHPEAYFDLSSILFERQPEWTALSEADFLTWLAPILSELELDPERLEADRQDVILVETLNIAFAQAVASGITYTPFLLTGGDEYTASRDLANMRVLTELLLLEQRHFSECPPNQIEPGASYYATLHTEKGDVILQLFPEAAPIAVNSFIMLAENGWFDQNPFFRVIEDTFAVTGDPSGTGFGGPGYTFRGETDAGLTFDLPGVVALSNANSPNTNGSQFFITLAPLSELNGRYTIFGQVIQGLDVLAQLTPRDPLNDVSDLPRADELLSVTIEKK
ncbi:MAG: peptidylprolyl isomerase [Anaerolineaceae bacterium]|nr:peptidylprolyl isomerase [Anaerolineaceae bacterium]